MRTSVRYLARRVTALDKAICTRLGLNQYVVAVAVLMLMMAVTAVGTGIVSERAPWLLVPGILSLALYCWVLAEVGELEQEEKGSKK